MGQKDVLLVLFLSRATDAEGCCGFRTRGVLFSGTGPWARAWAVLE